MPTNPDPTAGGGIVNMTAYSPLDRSYLASLIEEKQAELAELLELAESLSQAAQAEDGDDEDDANP